MLSRAFVAGLAALALLAPLVSAHICMFDPVQRGALVLDQPGDGSCAHKGPDVCGGVPAGPITATYKAGGQATIHFQQNLNHFWTANPGDLRVQIALKASPTKESDFTDFGTAIADFDAQDEISWLNFTVTGTMPMILCPHCVLRVAYRSNNALENDTSTDFYQCADIAITASEEGAVTEPTEQQPKEQGEFFQSMQARLRSGFKASAPVPSKSTPSGCTTPDQWESRVLASGVVAPLGQGMVSYDAKNRLAFSALLDMDSGVTETHYSNYSSGIEWRLLQDRSGAIVSCSPYGLDWWNDWRYGPKVNEQFDSYLNFAGQQVSVYINEPADLTWLVAEGGAAAAEGKAPSTCIPVGRQRNIDHSNTLFFNFTLGIADARIFTPPSACHLHNPAAWALSQAHDAKAVRAFSKNLPRANGAVKKHAATAEEKHSKAMVAAMVAQKHHGADQAHSRSRKSRRKGVHGN